MLLQNFGLEPKTKWLWARLKILYVATYQIDYKKFLYLNVKDHLKNIYNFKINVFRFKPKHTSYVQTGLNPQPTSYRPFSEFCL